VIENILNTIDLDQYRACFYHSSSHNEIDLVLEKGKDIIAIEIKRTFAPKLSNGFKIACKDIGSTQNFIVYPGTESFSLSEKTKAVGVVGILNELDKT